MSQAQRPPPGGGPGRVTVGPPSAQQMPMDPYAGMEDGPSDQETELLLAIAAQQYDDALSMFFEAAYAGSEPPTLPIDPGLPGGPANPGPTTGGPDPSSSGVLEEEPAPVPTPHPTPTPTDPSSPQDPPLPEWDQTIEIVEDRIIVDVNLEDVFPATGPLLPPPSLPEEFPDPIPWTSASGTDRDPRTGATPVAHSRGTTEGRSVVAAILRRIAGTATEDPTLPNVQRTLDAITIIDSAWPGFLDNANDWLANTSKDIRSGVTDTMLAGNDLLEARENGGLQSLGVDVWSARQRGIFESEGLGGNAEDVTYNALHSKPYWSVMGLGMAPGLEEAGAPYLALGSDAIRTAEVIQLDEEAAAAARAEAEARPLGRVEELSPEATQSTEWNASAATGAPSTPLEYEEIRHRLSTLTEDNPGVFLLPEDELEPLFRDLSRGGRPATPPTYKGTMLELPDGTLVGLRETSRSGGRTIDVFAPEGSEGPDFKVHVRK